jgi:hypothetical protein
MAPFFYCQQEESRAILNKAKSEPEIALPETLFQ